MFSTFVFFFYVFENQKIVQFLLPCLLSFNLFLIYKTGQFLKSQNAYFQNALDATYQYPESKIIFRAENYYPENYQPELFGSNWMMSLESLLFTAQKSKSPVKQVFIKEMLPDDFYKDFLPGDYLYYPDGLEEYISTLNKDYFSLKVSAFRIANSDAIQSNLPDSFFKNIHFNVGGNSQLSKSKKIYLPIQILNYNRIPLTSGQKKEPVALSYHWLKDGKLIINDGLRTPLMCDVITSINQLLTLQTPDIPGKYSLQVDLVYDGKRWGNAIQEKELYIN